MTRIVYGIVAVIAAFMLVNVSSLVCNTCTLSAMGYCMNSGEQTCSTNTSACFTTDITFPSVSNFNGLTTLGCAESAGCTSTTNSTLLTVSYTVKTECCSTDKCNTVNLNSATSSRLSLTAAIGAAILASAWGSML